jgi:hypothetical protein
MINNVLNIFGKTLLPQKYAPQPPLKTGYSSNPFASPFLGRDNNQNFAKNSPIQGGIFAGYYNGKSNIVGSRLFIEA